MRPVLLFCILSCGISWAFAVRVDDVGALDTWPGPASVFLLLLYMCGPVIAVALTDAWLGPGREDPPYSDRRPSLRRVLMWCLAAWALAACAAILVSAAQASMGFGASGSLQTAHAGATKSLASLVTVSAVTFAALVAGTFGFYLTEERAWRGWLQSRLSHLNAWTSSVLVGALWSVWLIPMAMLFGGEGGVVQCAALVVGFALAASPYLSAFAKWGGVLAASAFRSGLTVFASLGVLAGPDTPGLAGGLLSVTGVAILLFGWPVLVILLRRGSNEALNAYSVE